jgi:lysozyme family protein
MTAQNYPRCLANTLNEEGGWSNHPSDPGGPTMRGVIQREYTKYRAGRGLPNQSVRYISEAELQDIYRGNYWTPLRGDLWPKGPDQIVFDIGVNSGPARGIAILRAAMGNPTGGVATLAGFARDSADQVGLVKRACARRASFYRGIGTFAVFGRGWLARNARMEAIGVKMALEAQGVPVTTELEREKRGAAVKARRAGQGAATTGGGTAAGGGSVTQVDVSQFDWTVWLALGLTALAAVALTLALIWLWKKHGARAQAYAAALGDRLETDFASVIAKIKGGTA